MAGAVPAPSVLLIPVIAEVPIQVMLEKLLLLYVVNALEGDDPPVLKIVTVPFATVLSNAVTIELFSKTCVPLAGILKL